ncbi:MAG: hypothetical protein HRU38_05070 [Saccharospirillaceae bacterium]|nr:caspase family protein [Pseudomonadales bacterium]NRB78028.1 hypothetical protein [Saccharospirillaceae bacterium]
MLLLFKMNISILILLSSFMCLAQTITLPDGTIYEGELKDNLLSGQGSLTYSNNSSYIGQFKNGMFDGPGILINAKQITYDGNFQQGLFQGEGKYFSDNYSYVGNFEAGKFTGTGSFTDSDGLIYSGNYLNWSLTGEGNIIDDVGNTWTGKFEENSLVSGEYQGIDNTHYRGEFSYQQFDGLGTLTYPNGDVYIGEFSWGDRSGKGKFVSNKNGKRKEVLIGLWYNDEFQGDIKNNKKIKQQREREAYIYKQQTLLDEQFNALEINTTNQKEFYALTVAAFGNQSVFASEVQIINDILIEQGISKNHQVTLMNSMENLEIPWATHYAIKQSLTHIKNKMDSEEDILLMYASSHGNADLGISLNIHNMSLGSITPEQLSDTIKQSKIKWKVIIISACYSGVFIDALKDENSIIISAADSTHTSFGCSNDLDMTFFGKAYFQDAFKNLDFISTFNEAKKLVKIREEEQGYEFSNPQIHVGSKIRKHLGLTTQVIQNQPKILEFLKDLFGLNKPPQT